MSNRILIIAEAGVNHNGELTLAKKLIDEAANAGADYVKFQTFIAEKNISRYAPKAAYQQENTRSAESQLEMIKKLELSEKDHWELLAYCKTKNIGFLSTPFDFNSIRLIKEMGITVGKIPSGEIVNLPYLRAMSAAFPEIIFSTGMASMKEIEQALGILLQSGTDKKSITVLHCNTEYPTPMQDVNLSAMISIKNEFGVKVGYSDHTLGIEVPIAAVALGAEVIEKHFTLDKNMKGPDHRASLDPVELKAMVDAIRNIEKAMGDGIKKPSPSEMKNIEIVRKSIVAGRDIKKGEIFSPDNLEIKRPGIGISPLEWDSVVGKAAIRDFSADEIIEL
ncbi:N-acetylneuraminate synthase [Chitinophaga terrae (ex Kim and Jung 2007)]|uniref:N-acetylneuraminate synthase n=1 Tax=Chitinophaga terrae (ex Kim and Jung 2007) TaxID=408074 RepID=A0A1H3XX53_9BACT|nr:N-acetylneuraminate synthase [Chitinophaga terrae (ex Kim and Jung 2007)]GEP89448.1 N-acetylneuraminate synthase [Chitinophaga terrae (ex Kim and Jung 2007)]SEA03903.1 N-acetylneuraminate synthase [Chitinophaga terrae (ex Kim and Jung 2007)]